MAWGMGIAGLIVAYLLGALPTGYLVARAVMGIDIREHGSGNTGATNVLRVVGKTAGFTVLAIDVLKGLFAVLLLKDIVPALNLGFPPTAGHLAWWMTIAGLLAILGHSRSIWLNWTGGKSAATGLGVLFGLTWQVGLGAAIVFGIVLLVSRIVSLSSIAAALSAVLLMVLLQQPLPYILIGIAGSCYVVLRHRSNIQRLLAGTEPRLGSRPMS